MSKSIITKISNMLFNSVNQDSNLDLNQDLMNQSSIEGFINIDNIEENYLENKQTKIIDKSNEQNEQNERIKQLMNENSLLVLQNLNLERDNKNIKKNMSEIVNILNKYMKTNHNDINSEELKNMLILINNRKLRAKTPFPFFSY